ncbi:hypothetical protein KIN20_032600 [Parelaphostrongylus tenuis]|uniref:Uncharacterized protein n=1 Tax=Parelaphostrongylus tenuis TaxID=148309 RepID=A0AAD5R708_PARTN|nr:hypothetical protein KIN20_032600 [Parelaphostrongylus tenuis]
MARSFVARGTDGKLRIRKPRDGDQLFRGTPRYCSLNTHHRKEQSHLMRIIALFIADCCLDVAIASNPVKRSIALMKNLFQ